MARAVKPPKARVALDFKAFGDACDCYGALAKSATDAVILLASMVSTSFCLLSASLISCFFFASLLRLMKAASGSSSLVRY